MEKKSQRLFVGGLFDGIVEADLKERFQRFAEISSVDIRARKDDGGNVIKTFAYLDCVMTEKDFKQCMATFNKTKWKGNEMQIQVAKESYLDRLKREREEASKVVDKVPTPVPVKAMNLVIKNAAPGAVVDGKEDWVVGKYGTALPVVRVRTKDRKKLIRVDPSKYVHGVKRLDHGKNAEKNAISDASISKLTWEMQTPDTEITRKRKGQFPSPTKKKKQVTPKQIVSKESHLEVESTDSVTKFKTPPKLYHSDTDSDHDKSEGVCSSKTETFLARSTPRRKELINRSSVTPEVSFIVSERRTQSEPSQVSKRLNTARDMLNNIMGSAKKVTNKKTPSKITNLCTDVSKSNIASKECKTLQLESESSESDSLDDGDDAGQETGTSCNITSSKKNSGTIQGTSVIMKKSAVKRKTSSSSSSEEEIDNDRAANISQLGKKKTAKVAKSPIITASEKQKDETVKSKEMNLSSSVDTGKSVCHNNHNTSASSAQQSKKNVKATRMKKRKDNDQSQVKHIQFDIDLNDSSDNKVEVARPVGTELRSSVLRPSPAPQTLFAKGTPVDEYGSGFQDSDEVEEDGRRKHYRDEHRFSSDEDLLDAVSAGRTNKLQRIAKLATQKFTHSHVKPLLTNNYASSARIDMTKVYHSDSSDSDKETTVIGPPISHQTSKAERKKQRKVRQKTGAIVNSHVSSSSADEDDDDDEDNSGEEEEDDIEVDDPILKQHVQKRADVKPQTMKKPKLSAQNTNSASFTQEGFGTNTSVRLSNSSNTKSSEEDNSNTESSEEEAAPSTFKLKNVALQPHVKKDNAPKSDSGSSSSDAEIQQKIQKSGQGILQVLAELRKPQLTSSSSDEESLNRKEKRKNVPKKTETGKKPKTRLTKSPGVVLEKRETVCKLPKSEKTTSSVNADEKHAQANKKRLESVKQHTKQKLAQKSLMQKALSSVDSQPTKKIVFDSDSEEDYQVQVEDIERQENGEQSSDDNSTTATPPSLKVTREEEDSDDDSSDGSPSESDTDEDAGEDQGGDKKVSSQDEKMFDNKPKLFEDGDDSSEESDSERFRLRPQFEGKAGSKLMSLQTSVFGNDPRFKITEAFKDTFEEEEKELGQKSKEDELLESDPEVDNLTAEREQAMAILRDVVGKKLTKTIKQEKNFKDVNTLHYDPTKDDHKQFEVQVDPAEQEKKKKKKKRADEKKEPEPMPEVSKERFFEVKPSLTDAFKKEESEKPFSLLAMLGRTGEDKDKHLQQDDGAGKPIEKSVKFSWGEEEESDSDGEYKTAGKEIRPEPKVTPAKAEVVVSSTSKTFFFTEGDSRITESMKFFCRTEDLTAIRERWSEHRPDLVDAYRAKSKLLRGDGQRGHRGVKRGQGRGRGRPERRPWQMTRN